MDDARRDLDDAIAASKAWPKPAGWREPPRPLEDTADTDGEQSDVLELPPE